MAYFHSIQLLSFIYWIFMRSKEAWIQLFIANSQSWMWFNLNTCQIPPRMNRRIKWAGESHWKRLAVFPSSVFVKTVGSVCFTGISHSPITLCLSVSALRSPLSAKCRLHSEQSSVILLLLLWKVQTWHRLTASVVYPTRRTRAIVQRTWHGILGGNMADGWAPSSAGSQHLRQDSKPNRVSDSRAHI